MFCIKKFSAACLVLRATVSFPVWPPAHCSSLTSHLETSLLIGHLLSLIKFSSHFLPPFSASTLGVSVKTRLFARHINITQTNPSEKGKELPHITPKAKSGDYRRVWIDLCGLNQQASLLSVFLFDSTYRANCQKTAVREKKMVRATD